MLESEAKMNEATQYAEILSKMIQEETISSIENHSSRKFDQFRELLKKLFPALYSICTVYNFRDGIVLRWAGEGIKSPVLFMNHHDVVEASGKWKYEPFSGVIAENKLWGRGTLDDKGGLWTMLQAAEELVREEFHPTCDIWFSSSSTEETTGEGAREIANWFIDQGIHFRMSFDEGGMIIYDPIGGANGTFAMIGVGEKGCADLKFVARSNGGHASTPPRDTPLVRLGKFMVAAERDNLFETKLSPTICEMFRRFSPYMRKSGIILRHPEKYSELIIRIIPKVSTTAAALFRTTIAFTMAKGSEGLNVIPQEAWVTGNMRFSHHQGREKSFEVISRLAKKYGLEMEIINPGETSGITDYNGDAFQLTERAVKKIFPNVEPVPYIMTGASDSRFFDKVSDQCIRFLPFQIDKQQLGSMHGIDENVNLVALSPAVAFYRYLYQEV